MTGETEGALRVERGRERERDRAWGTPEGGGQGLGLGTGGREPCRHLCRTRWFLEDTSLSPLSWREAGVSDASPAPGRGEEEPVSPGDPHSAGCPSAESWAAVGTETAVLLSTPTLRNWDQAVLRAHWDIKLVFRGHWDIKLIHASSLPLIVINQASCHVF